MYAPHFLSKILSRIKNPTFPFHYNRLQNKNFKFPEILFTFLETKKLSKQTKWKLQSLFKKQCAAEISFDYFTKCKCQ